MSNESVNRSDVIPPEVLEARKILLDVIGFDSFESPQFAERIVCVLADLVQTSYSELWDGVNSEGAKVEVKYATSKTYPSKSNGRYMVFSGLHGSANEGKGADVYVLVGNDLGVLRYFVLASCRIEGYSRQAWIPLDGEQQGRTQEWFKYEVGDWQLRKAIKLAAVEKEMYEGINSQQPGLFGGV